MLSMSTPDLPYQEETKEKPRDGWKRAEVHKRAVFTTTTVMSGPEWPEGRQRARAKALSRREAEG